MGQKYSKPDRPCRAQSSSGSHEPGPVKRVTLAENSGVGIVFKDKSTLYFDKQLETAPQVGSFLNTQDAESDTSWEDVPEAP